MIATPRLPGVVFEAPPAQPDESLPRMDIAAFVGFAARGPLDLPVAIEGPGRFADIFGDDPELARDEERGSPRHAFLGAAVESFFAQGGLRCWVVRVADRDRIVRHAFALPGLERGADGGAAQARARCAGTWCEELRVGTARTAENLGRADADFTAVTGDYRFSLPTRRAAVAPGTLIEASFGDDLPKLWLFVDRVTDRGDALELRTAAGLDPARGESRDAFWVDESDPAAPARVAEADALARLGASPPPPPALRRLRFDLLMWRGDALLERFRGLAFDPRHERFWGLLPDDRRLFQRRLDESLERRSGQPLPAIAEEAESPRFSLAGPAALASGSFLPLGMGFRLDPEASREVSGGPSPNALEGDGLGELRADLFLDPALVRLGVETLRHEAEHRLHVQGIALRGLHSLLPVEEATLIAVPDAIHRPWSRRGPEPPDLLLPPILEPVGAVTDAPLACDPCADQAPGFVPLRWSAVSGATGYRLQYGVDPTFEQREGERQLETHQTLFTVDPRCPRRLFFRVRGERGGEIGPWSNTVQAVLPPRSFEPCEDHLPGDYELLRLGSPELLFWLPTDLANLPAERDFELQEATDAAFDTARQVHFGPSDEHLLAEILDGQRYYRVRAVSAGIAGPWSNTVLVAAVGRAGWTLEPPESYDREGLLAVQRSLLRFCAARGDLLALLAMPDHFRRDACSEHLALLRGAGAAPTMGSLFVLPLHRGERAALGFGAVFHPWLTGGADQRSLPPEGAAAGILAAESLAEGAWRAAANRPVERTLGLRPRFAEGDAGELMAQGLNLFLDQPRGYLALAEETLDERPDLRPIHVRRLLILLRRLALREGRGYVFENHHAPFRDRIRHTFERLLSELYQRGAFAGSEPAEAFRVIADGRLNPPTEVERGRLRIDLQVAPARALRFLTVRLVSQGRDRLSFEEIS
ncbi:MAG: hypothetical protein AAF604_16235 [Acidobacteriota bacterium]